MTELLRTGARRLIEAAVTAEFEEYLSGFVQEKLPDGRQRVVRNGHLPERKILTGLGEVDVRVPKSRSRSGSPAPFRSSVVPPYVRRCASLDAAIPWLYLHGVSTGRCVRRSARWWAEEAARGLSANVVSRLKRSWDEEYRQWCRRRLDDEWVYLWGGRHLQRTSRRPRAAVRAGGHWRERPRREALPGHRGRRARVHPELARGAAGDEAARLHSPGEAGRGRRGAGVLGGAVGSVSSDPNAALLDAQDGNLLNYLPKSGQAKAKQGLHEIWMAETKAQAERAFDDWLERYDDKYPKATACLARDRDELLAFYDFPAAHWTHLRTTNVIESAFATIRHRSSRAKGCVTRQTMLSMIYKMGRCAEKSWRRLRGFRQLAKVIQGVRFNDGIELIEDSKAAA